MFGIRIVREYERVMVFRLGRAAGIRGPGLVIVNPITDRTTLIDLREAYLEIPRQTAITRDDTPISIDFIIFYKVADPATTVLTVQILPERRRTLRQRRFALLSETPHSTTSCQSVRR